MYDHSFRADEQNDQEFSFEPAPVFDPNQVYFTTAEVSGVAGISKMTGKALNDLDAESGFASTLDQIDNTWYLNGAAVIWTLPLR